MIDESHLPAREARGAKDEISLEERYLSPEDKLGFMQGLAANAEALEVSDGRVVRRR